jgi:hypothetical protein
MEGNARATHTMNERMAKTRTRSGWQAASLVLFVLCFAASVTHAALPDSIRIQGVLTDSISTLPASVDLALRLYASPSGGEPVYSEEHVDVALDFAGAFSVNLGTGINVDGLYPDLTSAILSGDALFVEFEVDATPLAPRQALSAAAYALRSQHTLLAHRLAGDLPSAYQKLISGACPANQAIRSIDPAGNVVCEFDDGTDYFSGSGLTLQQATFAVDFTQIQGRIAPCGPENFIRSIAEDGSVVCTPDQDEDTTYDGDNGLTTTGDMLAANVGELQLSVEFTCPAGQVASAVDFGGNPTCVARATGDITGIVTQAGSGLDGGCTTGTCSLQVDPTEVQDRVIGACLGGQGIRTITSDGGVTCSEVQPYDVLGVTTPSGSKLAGGCTSGTCTLSVPSAAAQYRVADDCATGNAMYRIDQDGLTPGCRALPQGDLSQIVTSTESGLTGGCATGTCTLAVDPGDFLPTPVINYNPGVVVVPEFGDVSLGSVSITIPNQFFSGRLIVIATVEVLCTHATCRLDARATLNPAADDPTTDSDIEIKGNGNRSRPLVLTKSINITSSGPKTVHLYGYAPITGSSVFALQPRILVYYIP